VIENENLNNNNKIQQHTQFSNVPQASMAVDTAVSNVKGKILGGVLTKVDNEKSINKHSDELKKVANDAIKADIEKARLKVEQTNANNKAEKQKIKNELIILKTEAIRLKREKKQILKEQKDEHRKRNKDALWATYEKKLTKMGYGYVPNIFVLKMLLVIDGIVSFFEGIGKISTSIMKAIKWLLIIGAIFGILMIFPSTQSWILQLLGFATTIQ
jgi:hypothetical protein